MGMDMGGIGPRSLALEHGLPVQRRRAIGLFTHRCDHPFLLGLVASMQDEHELYMVIELVLGGELFAILRDQKKFPIETAVLSRLE